MRRMVNTLSLAEVTTMVMRLIIMMRKRRMRFTSSVILAAR